MSRVNPRVLTPVDPATTVSHPLTLSPSSAPQLALIGVGVRTVSFLSFKVYSAGFYANDFSLKRLRSLPSWAAYDPATLSEEQVQALLDIPTAVAVRIGEYKYTSSSASLAVRESSSPLV